MADISEPTSVVVVLFAIRAAFFFCSSAVSFSTGSSLMMLLLAVGSSARTVKVQSSWFCWKRRWMLRDNYQYSSTHCRLQLPESLLLPRHSIAHHPRPSLCEL